VLVFVVQWRATMALSPGTKLGPYEIVAALGAGGMGEVYRARDTRPERTVAIKTLPSHLSSNADLRVRFEKEAKSISALQHPNICVLHDIGSQGGVAYMVMEYVAGQTEDQFLDGTLLPGSLGLQCLVKRVRNVDCRAHDCLPYLW
jgi:eukaryotic-like serine/threonine-protein kinase